MKIATPKKNEHSSCAPEPIDPRVRRTRKLLEDAFRVMVEQKSFAALSVQDITDYATVNRATFYAHYTDKHDLASSVLRKDLRDAVISQFDQRPTLTPENLMKLTTAVFGFLESLHKACPKTASELAGSVGNTLQEELYEIVDHWFSGNNAHLRLYPGCSKATIATVISWSIYGAALRWSRANHREPVDDVCREIVSILLPPSR